MKNIFKIKKESGFALLFAVLVSSIVISIGATIISISIRQTLLSNTARESQLAFYAANTGLECAFYWDKVTFTDPKDRVFPMNSNSIAASSRETLVDTNANIIRCAGGNIVTGAGFSSDDSFEDGWVRNGFGTDSNSTKFRIVVEDTSRDILANSDEKCAEVTVTKTLAGSVVTTKIESKGYNTCDLDSPRAVERGLELEYEN